MIVINRTESRFTKFGFTVFLLLFTVSNKLFAFDSLLFKPLTANHLEARIGFFYQPNTEKLRLDIGHSLDMYEFISREDLDAKKIVRIRAGGDFFILSRLRSDGGMKFPVETADYYFGLNCTGILKTKLFSSYIENPSFRLRAGHISSHLIDGYTFIENDKTVFIQEPFVYSREFVDLVFAGIFNFSKTTPVRFYFGGTYVFTSIPKDANRLIPQIGFDIYFPWDDLPVGIIGGWDYKFNVGDKSTSNSFTNSSQIGLLFNLSKNVGVSANYYYSYGNSIHGMFYNQWERYKGFGIQINY